MAACIRIEGCRTARQLEGCRDGYKTEIEDRAEIFRFTDMLVLVVADGAGGMSGGAHAADKAIRLLRREAAESRGAVSSETWSECLFRVDAKLAEDRDAGETTCVVVAVSAAGVSGASVGDSQAWIVHADGCDNLTRRQERKPLLGSGSAYPIAFDNEWKDGTLLLGSDGLFKYADAAGICMAVRAPDIDVAAGTLLGLVRLPSGGLQDDIAVLLCRVPE